MNPLKLAHEIHDLARCINLLAHREAFRAREIKRMTIEIDNRIHEIIDDYARRGMEYDGS